MAHERDYLERTIATVRNHREADNCWPQWANIFADEIERLWDVEDARRQELHRRDEEAHDARELLQAAFVFLSRFVDEHDALVDGFDVDAWCERAELLGVSLV
jgi:hypothetical protein